MVKGPGPAVATHINRQSAEREARRLAIGSPNTDFVVMEAVSIHRSIAAERIGLDGKNEEGSVSF